MIITLIVVLVILFAIFAGVIYSAGKTLESLY